MSAHACGATGCRDAPELVVRLEDGRERTVCSDHARRAVDRRGAEVVRDA